MSQIVHILVSGHSDSDIPALQPRLAELPGVEVRTRILANGSFDPLASVVPEPDVLIHHLGRHPKEELAALAARPGKSRPTTLIIDPRGEAGPAIMRLAMHAGARDFVEGPNRLDDTLAAIRRIVKEKLSESHHAQQPLTAVINAKGGAGASSVAGNLAHLLATRKELPTLLLDLDVQFASQCLNFDLHPQQGITEALGTVDSLDEIALAGYIARHDSGLHVLGALPEQLVLPGELSEKRLGKFLDLAQHTYEHLVVDLPRLIDPVMSLVVERATRILIVTQQNLANIRDTQRLLRILFSDLGLPRERVSVVVNRYEQKNSIVLSDMERALHQEPLFLVPNDYKNFSTASNLGIPMAVYAPNSPATRALVRLVETVAPQGPALKAGILQRIFSKLSVGA